MTEMNDPILVITTFEHLDEAEKLARFLLEQHLVACARISGPGTGLYWWHGEIVQALEYQLSLKTDREHFAVVESMIKAKHPYETPEIIAVAIVAGSREYIDWMKAELRP